MSFWTLLLLLLLLVWAGVAGLWRLAHARRWLQVSQQPHHRQGPPQSVLWPLVAALVAAGLLCFVLLARAWQNAPALWLDQQAAALAQAAWSAPAQALALPVTHLGDPRMLWSIALLVGLLLWQRRERFLLSAWLAALGGNALWNPALKGVYERLRPVSDLSGVRADGYSFPSGHSSGAMVVFGMLAYLAWRLLAPRWHLPALLLAATLILLVGASRIFLQVHYASDVLAGLASGGTWLALCIAACAARHARPL